MARLGSMAKRLSGRIAKPPAQDPEATGNTRVEDSVHPWTPGIVKSEECPADIAAFDFGFESNSRSASPHGGQNDGEATTDSDTQGHTTSPPAFMEGKHTEVPLEHPTTIAKQQRTSRRLSHRLSFPVSRRVDNTRTRRGSDLTELLCEAAAAGNVQLIGRVLGSGGNIAKRNSQGMPPLHVAVMSGQGQAVRCLVRMGAQLNATDVEGYTCLHRAVLSQQVHLIPQLVNLGADINEQTSLGQTVLHLVGNSPESPTVIAESLPHARDADDASRHPRFSYVFTGTGGTASSRRGAYGRPTVIEALIRAGVNIEIRDKAGETALHIAVRLRDLNMALALVEQGAAVNVRNKNGLTPLDISTSAEAGEDRLYRILSDYGAENAPICKRRSFWSQRAIL